MISLSQTRYGSAVSHGRARHGRSRRWRSYQASSSAASGRGANRSCGGGETIGAVVRIDDMSREQGKPDNGTVPGAGGEDERRPGMRPVGMATSRLAGAIAARHGGGVLARLKADWPAIVGNELAAATWPQALGRGGVLKLRVAAAIALELQHRAPLLIERINVYLGRPAISRLVFVQGPLPLAPPARRGSLRQLGDAEAEAIERQIAAIGDSEP